MTKFCIACDHFFPNDKTCRRPLGSKTDPVHGVFDQFLRRFAINERGRDTWLLPWKKRKNCGPDARYFEPIPPRKPPASGEIQRPVR